MGFSISSYTTSAAYFPIWPWCHCAYAFSHCSCCTIQPNMSSIAFTTDTQLRAFRFGQSRGVTPEQIEFFIRLALFPNKIWYWSGLPFSWLHSGYSNSRGPTAFWERFFDTLVFPLVVFMEQQTGCISYILSYIV